MKQGVFLFSFKGWTLSLKCRFELWHRVYAFFCVCMNSLGAFLLFEIEMGISKHALNEGKYKENLEDSYLFPVIMNWNRKWERIFVKDCGFALLNFRKRKSIFERNVMRLWTLISVVWVLVKFFSLLRNSPKYRSYSNRAVTRLLFRAGGLT